MIYKVILLLVINILFISCCIGQNKNYSVYKFLETPKISNQNVDSLYAGLSKNIITDDLNYLEFTKYLLSIKPNYKDSTFMKSFYDNLGTALSFIGEYNLATKTYDSIQLYSKPYPIQIKNYKVENIEISDINETIKKIALDNRVILISEQHHVPLNRVLTYSLLDNLKSLGYTHLALEALGHLKYKSEKLVTKGYGFYTKEPNMANLIRYARKLGFKIVPYDFEPTTTYQERENEAAKKILNVLDQDKNAKILIHCGYDHAKTKKVYSTKMLGTILKDSIKNVTSISQHFFIDYYKIKEKLDFYNKLIQDNKITFPKIISSKDTAFNYGMDYAIISNIRVDAYKKILCEKNKMFKKVVLNLKLSENKFPLLLQFYPANEINSTKDFETIVPSENRIITSNKIVTYLPSGFKYLAIIRDVNNKIVQNIKAND